MLYIIIRLLGSLALFLYGMRVMSDGIQKSAGDRLRSIMNYVAANRFTGVLTGAGVTSLIQSSSATTVIVVSFVNAGLLTLGQSIGVIMGANIGTTATAWIVVFFGFKFDIATFALPSIGLGFILMVYKKINKKDLAEVFIGFGLLFLGLGFLKESIPSIKDNPEILAFITKYSNLGILSTLIFASVGMIFTALIHSSSASIAIFITMAFNGWIDFNEAVALVVGSKIGTTIDAFLASFGTDVNARRAAFFHIFFNVIGAIWVILIINPLVKFIDMIVPGDVFDLSGDSARFNLMVHIAAFHTIEGIINTIILLPFIRQIVMMLERIIKPKKGEISKTYQFKYLKASIQNAPEISIFSARKEISRMAGIAEEMYSKFLNVFHNLDVKMRNEVEELMELEEYTDQMQDQISDFLVKCAEENLKEQSAINVSAMLRIVGELESIGDACYNLIILLKRRYDKKIPLSSDAIDEIEPYTKLVGSFIRFVKENINKHLSQADYDKAIKMETGIDRQRNSLKRHAQERMQAGADVKSELLYIDMLAQMEQIGDYSLNIAQALRRIR
ncbi:MAG: Na/Pi cotransporter family protein [Spirochaetales bacterium]|nr:Na/Pi cotransporter family protein [Spirochaetales bacterium]